MVYSFFLWVAAHTTVQAYLCSSYTLQVAGALSNQEKTRIKLSSRAHKGKWSNKLLPLQNNLLCNVLVSLALFKNLLCEDLKHSCQLNNSWQWYLLCLQCNSSSTLGYVFQLPEVALHQSLPALSVLDHVAPCCPTVLSLGWHFRLPTNLMSFVICHSGHSIG